MLSKYNLNGARKGYFKVLQEKDIFKVLQKLEYKVRPLYENFPEKSTLDLPCLLHLQLYFYTAMQGIGTEKFCFDQMSYGIFR